MAGIESAIFFGGVALFVILRSVLTQPMKARERREHKVALRDYESLVGAPEGIAIKLTGRVRASRDLQLAPLSSRPCVGYLVRGAVWHSKKTPQLIADLRDAKSSAFILVLGDREIQIEPGTAVECRSRPVPGVTAERVREVLVPHKLERYAEFSELEEGVIVDGDRITVSGTIERNVDGEQAYRDPVQSTRFVATSVQPIVIADPKK